MTAHSEIMIQLHLEDAKARWVEINARVVAENAIFTISILVLGALVGLVSRFPTRASTQLLSFSWIHLAFSSAYLILGMLFISQRFAQVALAIYVNRHIRARVEGLIGVDPVSWTLHRWG